MKKELLQLYANKALNEKARFALRHRLYEESEQESIDLEQYIDVTYRKGVKGFSVLRDKATDQLVLVKALAEDGNDAYSYLMLSLEDFTEEEREIIDSNTVTTISVLKMVGFYASILILVSFVCLGVAITIDAVSAGQKLSYTALDIGGIIQLAVIALAGIILLRKKK